MRLFGRVICVTASFSLCITAYGASAPQRIVRVIDSSQVSEVQGNVPLAARRATDLGLAPGNVALPGLMLRFNMTAEQQSALTQLLQDQQNPKSERYHQWLTPEEFGQQFGLAKPDLQKISDWLTSQGFTVTQVARGGLFIRFSGTAGQVNAVFHTQIHQVVLENRTHFANLTDPQLPEAISAVTSGIYGLNDFHPKSRISSPSTKITAQTRLPAKLTPDYTGGSGNGLYHALAPDDFHTIYNETPLLTSGINGTGISIAVMDQSGVDLDDIAGFRAATGLPPGVPQQVVYGVDPGITPEFGDMVESELDLEWAGATAPGATIILVTGTDAINDSLTGAIDNDLAPILSLSYGDCENPDQANPAMLNAFYPLLQMANAQGQTIVAISGDWGAAGCDYGGTIATQGLAVEFPASSPNVTAVGGTMFNEGSGTYWSATNGPNGGSALSYIPEVAWNESIASATGGGPSRYFAKPYWQVGTGVPADSARDVPDVSLTASEFDDGYLFCLIGSSICTSGPGGLTEQGGTSAAAPSLAGILALLEQKLGDRIGNANPTLYALANSSYSSSVFHDVTAGSNAVPCLTGTPDCPNGGNIGYSAGLGYDLATGWGSINAANLVNSWKLVTPLAATTGPALSVLTLSGSPNTAAQGRPIQLTATVVSGSTTAPAVPTGTVQFLLDNVAVGAPVALNAGVATYALDTTSVSATTHEVQAAYSGDTAFTNTKASFDITVTSASSPARSASVAALSGSANTAPEGTAINLTATVVSGSTTNTAIPTGSVEFILDTIDAGAPLPLTAGTVTVPLNTVGLNLGLHTIWIHYLGDTNFSASKAVFTFTTTKGNLSSQIAFFGPPATATQGTAVTLVANISPTSPAKPTGTVQFLLDNAALGTPVFLNGIQATYSLDTTSLILGNHTVQATYSGDEVFVASQSAPIAFLISNPAGDFTLSPATSTVTAASGSSAVVPFTIAAINGFAGNVQFSVNFANALFTPNPVAITPSSSATTSLTLHAYTQTASSRPALPPWYPVGSGIALAGILMLVLPKRRRLAGLLTAVISTGILMASGCGGSTSPAPPPPPKQPTPLAPGTYPITITATGTSGTTTVTHTATISFIVQ